MDALNNNLKARCPKCSTTAEGKAKVEEVFGFRKGKPQSWCRACRGMTLSADARLAKAVAELVRAVVEKKEVPAPVVLPPLSKAVATTVKTAKEPKPFKPGTHREGEIVLFGKNQKKWKIGKNGMLFAMAQ